MGPTQRSGQPQTARMAAGLLGPPERRTVQAGSTGILLAADGKGLFGWELLSP